MLNKCIIDPLRSYYGVDVITLTLLALGADTNASVYRAETKNQLSYFIKVKKNHDPSSMAIIDLLHKAGIEHIIPPIKTLHDQSALTVDDFTIIVYPFINGQDGFNRALNDQQWLDLGKTLKQIHDMEVSLSLQHHIRRETYSPQWREAVRPLLSHERIDLISDEISEALWTYIKENSSAIKQLVERAEQLAHKLRTESLPFVLCHSDIHAGNILMDEEDNAYIVDWDAPIMAPKERDLMFIGGGVGNVWNKPDEEKFFYQGYGKTETNRMALAYYRHERIVEDIAIYSQEILFSTAKIEDKKQMYEHFIGMFEPRGVVEIAFETDMETS